jgi:hypothetical protein
MIHRREKSGAARAPRRLDLGIVALPLDPAECQAGTGATTASALITCD